MDVNKVKECGVCNNPYNEEERCPRILPCSHSFCTFCIEQLILKNDKLCPFCRQSFIAISAADLTKNATVLDLLKYINQLETQTRYSQTRSELVEEMRRHSRETINKNVSLSRKTVSDIEAIIQKNNNTKVSMAPRLLKLKYSIKTKIGNLEDVCNVKMKYLEEQNRKIKNDVREAVEIHKQCQKVKDLLDDATADVRVLSVSEKAEVCDAAVKTWITELQKHMSTDENISQEIAKSIQNAAEKINVIHEILSSIEVEEDKSASLTLTSLQEEYQGQISSGILRRMTTTTKFLVSLKGIYAVKEVKGKIKCAKLSMNDNKLCLHTLQEKQIPSYATTIEHEDAMTLVNPLCRLTFLDFGDEESTLGRVYIRLLPGQKRAQNFAVLCTGEKGPTYLGTSILGVGKGIDRESVYCGGYELDEYSVAKAVTPGVGKDKEQPVSPGAVYGCWRVFRDGEEKVKTDKLASIFSIAIRCCEDAAYPAVFGEVESGLNILTDIVSLHPDITKVGIKDSGIMLNLYLPVN